jgi:hypothetical protein
MTYFDIGWQMMLAGFTIFLIAYFLDAEMMGLAGALVFIVGLLFLVSSIIMTLRPIMV